MNLQNRIPVVLLLMSAVSLGSLAQQAAPTSAPPPQAAPSSQPGASTPSATSPATAPPAKTSDEIVKEAEKQRMLGVVPMFGMTNYKDAPPLTPRQKFRLMSRTTLDPFTWVAVGAQAGISQAENEFPAYGQGAAGYAKRYGAAFTDSFDSNFFSNFFYPVLFKQDPRYFRVGEGTVKKRMGLAIKQEFVARKDSGGHTFHFSNVLGAFTAGGLSNAYYPSSDRGFGLTVSRASIALGYGALGNMLLEFWPDISHKLFHKSENPRTDEPPGTTPK